jgi:hypothetical protein
LVGITAFTSVPTSTAASTTAGVAAVTTTVTSKSAACAYITTTATYNRRGNKIALSTGRIGIIRCRKIISAFAYYHHIVNTGNDGNIVFPAEPTAARGGSVGLGLAT